MAKSKTKAKETPLTPIEQAEREKKKLEREIGEWDRLLASSRFLV